MTPDSRKYELCRLAVEHGYRVVLVDYGGGDPSADQYVLIDLACDRGQSGKLWGSAPGGLDAIADHLAELICDMSGTDNHLSKLCRLVAEHGYRVVLIDGGGADPSAAQYVVIDLADDDGQSGELWGSTPCGLDAIVDHLAALVWDLWDTDERLANLFGEDSGPGG